MCGITQYQYGGYSAATVKPVDGDGAAVVVARVLVIVVHVRKGSTSLAFSVNLRTPERNT